VAPDVETASANWTYTPSSMITGVSPQTGLIAPGETVTVTGTYIDPRGGVAYFVLPGGNLANSISVPVLPGATDSQFQVISPVVPLSFAGEWVDIQVYATYGWTPLCAADEFKFLIPTGLGVTGVSPSSGPVAGGTAGIIITGSDLDGVTAVDFGSVAAASFTPNADGTITATSPASPGNAPGPVDVTVDTEYGWTAAYPPADQFTYYVPTPTVISISPAACGVTPAGGQPVQIPVTITGSNLLYATQVDFGSLPPVTAITYNADGTITVLCPASNTPGPVNVTVVSPGGTSAASPTAQFAYGPVPTISAIDPDFGPAWDSTYSIEIWGENLSGVTAVDFGSSQYQVTNLFHGEDNFIRVDTAYEQPGTVDVRALTSLGLESAITTADEYTFTYAPIVTGVAAAASAANPNGYPLGPATGGTSVTISCDNLLTLPNYYPTAVDFGGVPAASFTYIYPSTITAVTPPGAPGNASVTVTTPEGTSSTAYNDDLFTYFGVPSVTGVTPAAGPLAGGNTVVVAGAGFDIAMIAGYGWWSQLGVDFGGVAGTVEYYVGDNLLVAVPAGVSAGTVDVTVTTPGGTSPISQPADQYTYLPPPVVTGVSLPSGAPASGAVGGGTPVVITGTALANAVEVGFGGQEATITSDSDDEIAVVSPASYQDTAGPVDVTVTTLYGGTSAISEPADLFTYTLAPFISQVTGPVTLNGTQAAGLLKGDYPVTIQGDDLAGATAVNFGNTPATSFTCNPDGSITAIAPAGTADGMVDITVTTPVGTSDISTADQFTYGELPSITAISPSSGPVSVDTQVTITGTGLAYASAVDFGPGWYPYYNSAGAIQSDTDGQIVVVSPWGGSSYSSTVDVRVVTPFGTSVISTADQFSYVAPPSISTQDTYSGPVVGGTTVTIGGTDLENATVDFGANPATITSDATNQIVVVSPEATGDSPGPVSLTVTTPFGTASSEFTYMLPPDVTAISPSSGAVTGGTWVTISGDNLPGATEVDFGGVPTYFYNNSDGTITASSPAGAVSRVDVTVVTPGGTSDISPADQFTYLAAPSVSGISPAGGFLGGGQPVTISGTGLANATAVEFYFGWGYPPYYYIGYGDIVSNNTDGQIVVSTPGYPYADTTTTCQVLVVTAEGQSPASPASQFTYYVAPTVTGMSPASGLRTGGTLVTISGYYWNTVTAVEFGQNLGAILNQSYDQVQVYSPAGTVGTADVTVFVPGGGVSAGQFTYLPLAPAVSGVSPSVGAATGGTAVIITGTDLEGATAVDFGATAASSFTIDSSTQITATDAAGTVGTVDVTVTTPGGTSTTSSADQFTGISAPAVSGVKASAGSTAGGSDVLIWGTDLEGATTVNFGQTAATIVADTDTYILAATPPSTPGTIDVTVTTPYGTSATSPADQFTFVAPPVAAADSYTATQGSTLTVAAPGVLANDTGPKGSYYGLTASLVTGPANGTLSLDSDGSFTYTPNPGYFGTDSFTYEAGDSYGNSAPATVSITVAPATLTWVGGGTGQGGSTGNWTDQRWSGASQISPYPNNTVNALVVTPSVVQVTSDQAACALAISQGGQVAIGPGAVLSVTTSTSVMAGSTLSVDPDGALFSGGTVTVNMGSLVGGPVVAAAYQLNAGTVSADLYGAGGLTVGTATSTAGTVTLSGANAYAGPTVVNAGTLIVANAGALPDGSSLTVGAGAAFAFGAGPAAASSVLITLRRDAISAAVALTSGTSTPAGAANSPANVSPTASALSTPSPSLDRQVENLSYAPATVSVAQIVHSSATPTAPSTAARDAVFASHRSAAGPTVASADSAQSPRPWAWLAAIEGPWNAADQNQTTDSTVTALDKVLARLGI
jgi:autotransporter-associated beta strand protein